MLVALAASLLSCNENKNTETGNKPPADKNETATSSTDNRIQFKVNNGQVDAPGWNISRFDFGNGAGVGISLMSDMHTEPRTISININGQEPGVYKFQHGLTTIRTPGIAYGSYRPDYLKDMMNVYNFEDGEFVIEKIDTVNNIIDGSFSGTVKNNKGESLTVVEGKVVRGRIRAGVVHY
jgi:hypothetical protein